MTGSSQEPADLRSLARLYGIQTSYVDLSGRTVRASRISLLAALKAIGAPVEVTADLSAALRSRIRELWEQPLEPVLVAWGGRPDPIKLRLPLWLMEARRRWSLVLEDAGGELDVSESFLRGEHGVTRAEQVEGATYVEMEFSPALDVPVGYHRLGLEYGGSSVRSLVISAPRTGGAAERPSSWGVFLPLYALRSQRSWGLGDLTDIGDLMEWMADLGGDVAATLPILSAFLSEPFEPSPYSPASRLFWNEVHLDVVQVAEQQPSEEAWSLLRSRRLRREIAALQGASLVDHRGAMAAKRRVLEALAANFFAEPSRRPAFQAFASQRTIQDYASFRANVERRGAPWRTWPRRERDGVLPREGGDRRAFRYHTYVQWLMSQQMEELGRRATRAGARLYFDFPLGVHPDGYDTWREREVFAMSASAGAPPDPFFTAGQDWGFHPLHPERIREQGYRYPISCLRHILRHAGVLRIDHVMSLHRLYWVPHGLDARHGVYVRNRPEELYAILALESARGDAVIVGEDLGTVPQTVRRAMARHGVYRSYVLQMEIRSDPRRAINPTSRRSLASLNTHDLPPFAGFWKDRDLAYRIEQGWIDVAGARRERAERARLRRALTRYLRSEGRLRGTGSGKHGPGAWEVLQGCLSHLAAGEAEMVLINLEDLWLEARPQNVPGTKDEYPNWRRPARYPFERFRQMRRVTGTLKRVDELRKKGES